jgi:hypothetical protein
MAPGILLVQCLVDGTLPTLQALRALNGFCSDITMTFVLFS